METGFEEITEPIRIRRASSRRMELQGHGEYSASLTQRTGLFPRCHRRGGEGALVSLASNFDMTSSQAVLVVAHDFFTSLHLLYLM